MKDIPGQVEIGPCPVCGKGTVLQGKNGWMCNWFRSLDDHCEFAVYAVYDGYRLTHHDVRRLLAQGRTGPHVFTDSGGHPYMGDLVRDGENIRFEHTSLHPVGKCPCCGNAVIRTNNGYICYGSRLNPDITCKFRLGTTVWERPVSHEEILSLLDNRKTGVLDGFVRNGRTFSGMLRISDNGQVVFDNHICDCPKCGGTIHVGTKSYHCSNYRNPAVKCSFQIWRTVAGHEMLPSEVALLCSHKHTDPISFMTREGKVFTCRLVLKPDFTLGMG